MIGDNFIGGGLIGEETEPYAGIQFILYATSPTGGTNVLLRTSFGTEYALAGSIAGQATVTGTLFDIGGSPSGDSSVTGNLSNFIQFSGTSSGAGTATGDLSVYLSGGLASGDGSVTGDLTNSILRASTSGDSTVAGNLTGDIFTMSASSTGTGTVTGNLSFLRVLAGDIFGDSSLVATLFSPVDGTGVASGDSTVTGDLVQSNLYAAIAGNSTVVANASYLGGLLHAQANPIGEASLVVNMRWRGLLHPETCSGTATTLGEVRKLWLLGGTPAGDVSLTGQFDIYTLPGGPIVGDSSCTTTDPTIDGHMTGTINGSTIFGVDARNMLDTYDFATPEFANGEATTSGYLYDHPQDFEVDPSSGASDVTGKIVLSNLAFVGTSAGSTSFTSSILGLTYSLPAPQTIAGFATVDLAILFINDSGLSRGSTFITADVGINSSQFFGAPHGFATFLFGPSFTLPGDLAGKTVDTWSGVGTWHPGAQTFVATTQEIDQPPPVQTGTDVHGNPVYGSTAGVGEGGSLRNNTEYINVGVWDGTYVWGPSELGIRITDPETGSSKFVKNGALKRQAQLADPGELGGWYVDFKDYRTRHPWGTASGKAAVTSDLFVEAKNALYGRPVGTSTMSAALLRTAVRLLMATGNVALAVALSQMWAGNAAKSSSPTLPIDDPTLGIDPEVFVPPVQKRRTMYV